jgi:hypothetical protein
MFLGLFELFQFDRKDEKKKGTFTAVVISFSFFLFSLVNMNSSTINCETLFNQFNQHEGYDFLYIHMRRKKKKENNILLYRVKKKKHYSGEVNTNKHVS